MSASKDFVTQSGVDLLNFSFNFTSIYTNPSTRQVFFKFQQLEYNTEPVLFVQECIDLENIPYPEKQEEAISLALHIFDTYAFVTFTNY